MHFQKLKLKHLNIKNQKRIYKLRYFTTEHYQIFKQKNKYQSI